MMYCRQYQTSEAETVDTQRQILYKQLMKTNTAFCKTDHEYKLLPPKFYIHSVENEGHDNNVYVTIRSVYSTWSTFLLLSFESFLGQIIDFFFSHFLKDNYSNSYCHQAQPPFMENINHTHGVIEKCVP